MQMVKIISFLDFTANVKWYNKVVDFTYYYFLIQTNSTQNKLIEELTVGPANKLTEGLTMGPAAPVKQTEFLKSKKRD